jgi:hypothetical protein
MTQRRSPRQDLDVAYVLAQETLQLCRQVIAESGDKLPVYTIVKLKQILGEESSDEPQQQ